MLTSAAIGLALAPGCTVTETTAAPGPPYPTEDSFCQAVAGAVCNANVVTACYGSAAEDLAADQQKCIQAGKSSVCNPGNLNYHPEQAETCLAAYTSAYADAKISQSELDVIAASCLATFYEGNAAGDECKQDSDCNGAAGQRCIKKGTKGSCQVPKPVEAGKNCDAIDAVCPEGLYCGKTQTGSACVDKAPVGFEGCSDEVPCVDEARCDPEDKKCVAKADNNADCTADGECKGGLCSMPTGADKGKCTATITLAQTDSRCDAFR
ncbi:MAG: hypothetical protein HY744_16015 [Deltaproteobacteria bacterium]|nr:hypothetical protein [Deltaproteobacteria bacterium]